MNNNRSVMILNGQDIGISKIELNESDLLITDKSTKYCLQVCMMYNWKEINKLEVGKKVKIDFNEYCFAENNESALIWPSQCYIHKPTEESLSFYIDFDDLKNETHYMSKRSHFDIELKSLKVKIFIDYKDSIGNSIIYRF